MRSGTPWQAQRQEILDPPPPILPPSKHPRSVVLHGVKAHNSHCHNEGPATEHKTGSRSQHRRRLVAGKKLVYGRRKVSHTTHTQQVNNKWLLSPPEEEEEKRQAGTGQKAVTLSLAGRLHTGWPVGGHGR